MSGNYVSHTAIEDKALVEQEILRLLQAFESRTKLRVVGIDVKTIHVSHVNDFDLQHKEINMDVRL